MICHNRCTFCRAIVLFLGLGVLIFWLIACEEREHTNPLDAQNPTTRGIPTGLKVNWENEQVMLRWPAFSFKDLKGYNVHRKPASDSQFNPIATTPTNFYEDPDAISPGLHQYDYTISVLSKSGAESLTASPVSVETFVDTYEGLSNGELSLISQQNEIFSFGYKKQEWSNFIYSVRVRGERSAGRIGLNAAVSLIFRAQDLNLDRAYVMMMYDSGTTVLSRRQSGNWYDIDIKKFTAPNIYQWNQVEIKAEGNQFTISINNNRIMQAYDSQFIKGYIGVGAQDRIIGHFDDLKIYALKK